MVVRGGIWQDSLRLLNEGDTGQAACITGRGFQWDINPSQILVHRGVQYARVGVLVTLNRCERRRTAAVRTADTGTQSGFVKVVSRVDSWRSTGYVSKRFVIVQHFGEKFPSVC